MASVGVVQRGSLTMASASELDNVTITAVDMTKAFLRFTKRCASDGPSNILVAGKLTSTTNIEFTRATTGGGAGASQQIFIEWEIVEFTDGVNVQRGDAAPFDSGSGTVDGILDITISAVDVTKSWSRVSYNNAGSFHGSDDMAVSRITSSTNLQLQAGAADGLTTDQAPWQVIEYDTAVVQKLEQTLSANTTDVAITAVDLTKSFTVSAAWTIAASYTNGALPIAILPASTTLRWDRLSTITDLSVSTYVVELGGDETADYYAPSLSASTGTVNQTITSRASARSTIQNAGLDNDSNGVCNAALRHIMVTYARTSDTNVTVQRQGTQQSNTAPFWVIDWAGGGGAGGDTISPTGIAPTVAFGTPTIAQAIAPAGIAPTAAFGTPTLSLAVAPGGIASTVQVGTPSVSQTVHAEGIAPTAALGTPTVVLRIAPEGIAPTVQFGTPNLTDVQTIAPAGISSTVALGTPSISQRVSAQGIAPTLSMGTPAVSLRIQPAGIAPTVQFGTPTILAADTIAPLGIAPTVQFGTLTIGTRVTPAGIASTVQVGTPAVVQHVAPAGIAPTAQVGTPAISTRAYVTGIAPTAQVGTPSVAQVLRPTGIAPTVAFGTPTVVADAIIAPPSIAPSVQFGTPTIVVGSIITPAGIAPTVVFGTPRVWMPGGPRPHTILLFSVALDDERRFNVSAEDESASVANV